VARGRGGSGELTGKNRKKGLLGPSSLRGLESRRLSCHRKGLHSPGQGSCTWKYKKEFENGRQGFLVKNAGRISIAILKKQSKKT